MQVTFSTLERQVRPHAHFGIPQPERGTSTAAAFPPDPPQPPGTSGQPRPKLLDQVRDALRSRHYSRRG